MRIEGVERLEFRIPNSESRRRTPSFRRRAAKFGLRASLFGLLASVAASAWAQESITGSSTSAWQEQHQGSRDSSSMQESLNLNFNAPLSPDWRTAWYGNILWLKDSELDYPDFRPYLGGGLFSEGIRLNTTYAFFQDRNYKDATATLETSNWAASLAVEPANLPDIILNYNIASTLDDLSPHEVDVDRTSRSIRVSERIADTLDLFYMHTDSEDVSRTSAVMPSILFTTANYAAVDATGAVYVVDYAALTVSKFNSSGGLLLIWGSPGTGPGQFNAPTGIAVDPTGNVYVADSFSARIQKFDGNGNFLLDWGSPGAANGQFNNPGGLAADATGVYVADTDNNRIQKFDFNGTFLLAWGSAGGGNGQFLQPQGVASDGTNVFVADTANHRVQSFDVTGVWAATWGSFGSGNGQISSPRGIAGDGAGFVYVADTGNNRIQRFTTGGAYAAQWGTAGTGDGQFANPIGIAVDGSFNVFVVDSGNDRVQRFQTNGAFVGSWGNTTVPVGETRRRSRIDSVGGSFSKSFRNVLTIGSTFGLDRSVTDDNLALGETVSTNSWVAPTLGVRLLRNVQLSYNLYLQDLETSLPTTETKRLTQNQNVAVNITPFTGVLGVVAYNQSAVREDPGVDSVTQGPSVSASMSPFRFMSLNVGLAQSRSQVGDLAPTVSWLLTAMSNVSIYRENTLAAGYSRSESEARETGSRGTNDTLNADLYLLPWRTLRVTERSSVSFSSSEGGGSTSESETWSMQTAVSWSAGAGTTMSSVVGYSVVMPGGGPRTDRWTDVTSFGYQWRSNNFYLFHSLVREESTTQQLGASLRVGVSRAGVLGLFAQRGIGGATGGDRIVRIDFTVSF